MGPDAVVEEPQALREQLQKEWGELLALYGAPEDQDDAPEPDDQQESVDQIDELSKSTLKSYVSSARHDADRHSAHYDTYSDKAMAMRTQAGAERWLDKAEPHIKSYKKRQDGIKKAKMRLSYAK